MPAGIVVWERKIAMSRPSELAGAGPARPWPAERIEDWAIERLVPYADNARVHSEADIDKLVASLRRWGWTNPVLVDEPGVLISATDASAGQQSWG